MEFWHIINENGLFYNASKSAWEPKEYIMSTADLIKCEISAKLSDKTAKIEGVKQFNN